MKIDLIKLQKKLQQLVLFLQIPLIRIPSAAANFTLGAMNSPTPTDRGLDYMGLFGSTPSSLNSFKQIGRRAPFFKAISAADALSDFLNLHLVKIYQRNRMVEK